MTPYEAFWGVKPGINWLRTYGCKCWVMIPKQKRRKGQYKSIKGVFVGYYDNLKAYKIWVPRTQMLMKSRDVIFDKSNRIECTKIHASNDDNFPNPWIRDIPITTSIPPSSPNITPWTDDVELPFHEEEETAPQTTSPIQESADEESEKNIEEMIQAENEEEEEESETIKEHIYAPKDLNVDHGWIL